jgi:hypothetical protein
MINFSPDVAITNVNGRTANSSWFPSSLHDATDGTSGATRLNLLV